MANIKISALPAIDVYDNGSIIPIVDPLSTQTSKIEIMDLMRAKDQSIVGTTSLILTSGINLNDAQITGGDRHTILSARGALISDNENSVIMSTYPGGGQPPRITGGGNTNSIMSVYNDVYINNSYMSSIIADENSKISGGYTNFIGGSNNVSFGTLAGGGYKITSLGSSNGNVESATEYSVIASRDFSTHLQGSNTGSIIASKNSTVEPVGSNAEIMSVVNSSQTTIKPNGHMCYVVNSESSTIDDSNNSNTRQSMLMNSSNSNITGNNIGNNYQKFMLNGYNSSITDGGEVRSGIVQGNGVTISTSGNDNLVVNSQYLTVGGSLEGVTVIGGNNNDAKVLNYNDTVYVDNLHNLGSRSGKILNAGNVSGTVDVDASLAEHFIFTMVGNVEPNFINLREGSTFTFSIYNSTFSVTGGTIDGVGGNVLAKSGSISPSNNSWSYYDAFYDGTRVYLIEENGLSAI